MATSEKISIAPGERKKPTSVLQDKYCEELAFAHNFQMPSLGLELSEKLN